METPKFIGLTGAWLMFHHAQLHWNQIAHASEADLTSTGCSHFKSVLGFLFEDM